MKRFLSRARPLVRQRSLATSQLLAYRIAQMSCATPTRRVSQIANHLHTSAPRKESDSPAVSTDLVKLEARNSLRVLTLNRPKKLNALNLEMITAVGQAMNKWADSQTASVILLKGEGGKAFCAGGDVEALTEDARHDDTRVKSVNFFRDEYETDSFIAKIPKPIITFMDGITMGGGVGLSAHASFRVATERTTFAMPETTIGLFPDVGANFFLPRLDGRVGLWMGLTSDRLSGNDCFRVGIATHYIPSDRLPQVEARLAELDYPKDDAKASDLVNNVLNEFQAEEQEMSSLPCSVDGVKRQAIDWAFSQPSVLKILDSLKRIEEGSEFKGDGLEEWAKKTRETIEFRSPTSCVVAFLGYERGRQMDISSVFQLDMRLASQCVEPAVTTDFIEGVDQVLVKTKTDKAARKVRANWKPSTLQEIDVAKIKSDFFDGPLKTKLPVPQLENKGKTYTSYPHLKYALPSEDVIGQYIQGSAKDSGSFAISSEQSLVDILSKKWNQKIGIKAKVKDVVARRTTKDKDGNLRWRY